MTRVIARSLPKSPRISSTLNEQIYQQLRWGLIVGEYAPDDAMSIRRVASKLGTSMTPVREALKRLLSERAITSSGNRSFRVAVLQPKHIANLFFVRSRLEGIATELATPLLPASQVDRLEELAALMDQDVDEKDFRNYLSRNYSFHFTIYASSGNAELVSIIEALWARTGPFLAAGVRRIGMSMDWRRMHGKIAEAVRLRDSATARVLIEQDVSWGAEVFQDIQLLQFGQAGARAR
jgi:DNA-binding GntR family transcriptional regulator